MIRSNINKVLLFCLLALPVLAGCQQEGIDMKESEPHLEFVATLLEPTSLDTRAPLQFSIPRDSFETKFYFASLTGQNDKACATYIIPVGHEGMFRSYGLRDSLNWTSPNASHQFYAWTMPWVYDENAGDSYNLKYEPYADIENTEGYLMDGTPISFEADNAMYADVDDNTNCKILETFVGAKTSKPVTFNQNGDYVNLTFRHLVSKIYIRQLRFSMMDDEGNITNSIATGKMTFVNMPSEGIFYREGNDRPVVVANPDKKMEVTYDVRDGACLYVCPGVDFSKVEFRITAETGVKDQGEFLGDFKSVYFERDESDWWDQEHLEDVSNPNCHTTLYAGETMTMVIYLRQARGTYISVAIGGWGTQPAREGSAYPHPGIYNDTQLREFYDTLRGNFTDEMEEEMFAKYGETFWEDGEEKKEYRFYEDVKGDLVLRFGKNYVVNGMGHTVTFDGTYSNNQLRISKCKDIYLTDGKGHTLYIDNNFEIYIVDEYGNMTSTGNRLDDKLDDGKNSYLISLETGEFKQDAGV